MLISPPLDFTTLEESMHYRVKLFDKGLLLHTEP